MSLIIDKVKCLKETHGWPANDEIYLLVFGGRALPPFDTKLNEVSPGKAWDEFDSGETVNQDAYAMNTWEDGVYAVMMLERDGNQDIIGAKLDAFRTATDLVWKTTMGALLIDGLPTNTETAKVKGYQAIRNALSGLSSLYTSFPVGNDDVLDIERVTINQPGQDQNVYFFSPENNNAHYQVTFKHIFSESA